MIPSSACQLSPAETPGPNRRAAKTYTTPRDTILVLYEFSGVRMTEREKPFIPVFDSKEIARLGKGKPYIFRGTEEEMTALLVNRLRDTFGALTDVAAQRDAAGERATNVNRLAKRLNCPGFAGGWLGQILPIV